jgi:hypothetical protein
VNSSRNRVECSLSADRVVLYFGDDAVVIFVIDPGHQRGQPPARRSRLSVPGSLQHKLDGAATGLGADEIVIDLEDAVAAPVKEEARAVTVAALAGWDGRVASVRVNAMGPPECHQDVVALAGLANVPVSIVVPKVECG